MTSPPTSGSTRPASAPPRHASPPAPTSCWRARRSSLRRMRELSSNVLDAPNVADTALFAQALRAGHRSTRRSTRCRRPRLVFTGRDLGDQARHRAARRARPRAARLVARAGRAGRARRPAHRRRARSSASRTSTCSASAPTSSFPAVLRGADAGLIPYVRSELTDSIFPMKVYEYLAAGPAGRRHAAARARGRRRRRHRRRRGRLSRAARGRAGRGQPAAAGRALARRRGPLVGCAPAGDRERDREAPRGSAGPERPARHDAHADPALGADDAHLRDRPRARRGGGPDAALRALRGRPARTPPSRRSPGSSCARSCPRAAPGGCSPTAAARLRGVPDGFARGISPELAARARPPGRERRAAGA